MYFAQPSFCVFEQCGLESHKIQKQNIYCTCFKTCCLIFSLKVFISSKLLPLLGVGAVEPFLRLRIRIILRNKIILQVDISVLESRLNQINQDNMFFIRYNLVIKHYSILMEKLYLVHCGRTCTSCNSNGELAKFAKNYI